jgi:hypothetical protein
MTNGNTLKDLLALQRKHPVIGETYCIQRGLLPTSIIAMLHQYHKTKFYYKYHVFIIETTS